MTHAKSACNVAINQSKGDEAMIHLHWPKLKHRHFLFLHPLFIDYCSSVEASPVMILCWVKLEFWKDFLRTDANDFYDVIIAVFRLSHFFVVTCETAQIFTFPIKLSYHIFLAQLILGSPQMSSPRFASFSHVYLGLHSINIYSHSNGASMEFFM